MAPNPGAGNVSAEMLAAMQRDLKVTGAQAKARLVRADWATRLDNPLRQRLGRAYAGSWLAEDGQEFVVAVTDRKQERLVRASGGTPKLVKRTEAELLALSAKLDARATKAKGVPDAVTGWAVDPQTNRIRVQHLPGGRAAAEAFAAATLTADEVSYEMVPTRPEPVRDIPAGSQYFTDSGSCSTGFAVYYPNIPGVVSKLGFLTAAHCGFIGGNAVIRDPITPRYMGIVSAHAWPGEHDEAVVTTNSPYFPVERVATYGHGIVNVTDGAQQVDGSPVCTSGATTAWRCGTIRPGLYSNTSGATPFRNLKAHNICNLSGDSGGPVVSGTHGQGITSRGYRRDGILGGCPWFTSSTYSYYVPLQRALLQFGAELKTTPAPAPPPTPTPSSKWTTGNKLWGGVGGATQGKVASVAVNPNLLQAFVRGTDNRLHFNTFTDGLWRGWQSLGAADALTGPPTAIARAGGVDVYYRGVDTRPYLRRWNGSAWEAPVKLGEIDVEGTITAINAYGDHVILFIRSSDDEVYYNFRDGATPWSGWLGLGGDTNASPTAVARTNASGQTVFEVYARWADDNVRYRRLDPAGPPGWQPWVNLGGIWKETPVPVAVGPNQSWLIGWARDDNTVQVQRFKDGDWLRGAGGAINTGWRGLGGNAQSSPTAVAGPGEQIRVFARDANQRINMITWPGGDIFWESWAPVDGDTAAPVGATLRTNGQTAVIDAFAVDAATSQPFHTTIGVSSPAPQVTTSETAPAVGVPGYLTVTGAPGAPVRWSSTKDNVQVENHAFYGQHLDGDGRLVVDVGEWPSSAVGSWVKQVHVGTETEQTAQVAFTVSHRPITVQVDKDQYQIGENLTYVVTGPPNRPISWTNSVNGLPAEPPTFNGQHSNADGVFTVTAPWTDPHPGNWITQIYIDDGRNGQFAETTFGVIDPSWPVTIRTNGTSFGFGSFIDYAVTGPPNQTIYWTRWVNGALVQNNSPGESTDANGAFTMSVPWTDVQNGTHVVQVSIGGRTAQTTFVFDWPQPPPPGLLPGPMTPGGVGGCLDIEGASLADGARAQLSNSCPESPNQQWHQVSGGGLAANHSGKCLRPVGTAQGSTVQQVTCDAQDTLQAWEVARVVNGAPYFFNIKSVSTGLCLSVHYGSANGGSVFLWPCGDTGVSSGWTDPSPPAPPPGLPPPGDW